jgi:hypothetical protein
VDSELLVQAVVACELGLGRQIQLQVAIDDAVAGGGTLKSPSKLKSTWER